MDFKNILGKVGNVAKGAAKMGVFGPAGMAAGHLLKRGGKIKKKRDQFTEQYD